MHEYRKKTTIKAEQFDGSDEMIKKYRICTVVPPMVNNDNWYLLTEKAELVVKKGDWITTSIDGTHWVIADDIFRRTYERCD